ncbi:hypothetical protein MNBD_CHLOROFLEXI01-264 [hydrothermal vent metagenome]|uniref:Uncharacterized protein n=1 Tax=hydrothermal vent metagenome TaxID=652676 RepID=A0A3B0V840_9ZZZZ
MLLGLVLCVCFPMSSPDCSSFALLAANARLAELRTAHWQLVGDLSQNLDQRPVEPVQAVSVTAVHPTSLPSHLGWGSTPVSTHLRQAEARRPKTQKEEDGWWWKRNIDSHSHHASPQHTIFEDIFQTSRPSTVKLYPDIGLGMLRQEQAAAGRIWLLLRYADAAGRGWVNIAEARSLLTSKESAYTVCGWRQLRNLLKQGEGVFWQRDKVRIWLRSAAKVAYALGVARLTGQPVGLPISALTGGIGEVRAHLYASFHSGRVKENTRVNAGVWSPPIARDTLTAVSGVGRVTQRMYEKCSGTKVHFNFAVGESAEEVNRQRQAWKHGQALFELKDYRGQQGKAGKTYLAWQLPNTYIGRHQQRPKGRQKRINRTLNDLVMKGMPGTAEESNEMSELTAISEIALTKRYYPNGKLAAKAYGRKPEHELYWKRHKTRNGRFAVWQELEAVL